MLAFQKKGNVLSLTDSEKTEFFKLYFVTQDLSFFSMDVKEKSIVSSATLLGLKMQICSNALKTSGRSLSTKKILHFLVHTIIHENNR